MTIHKITTILALCLSVVALPACDDGTDLGSDFREFASTDCSLVPVEGLTEYDIERALLTPEGEPVTVAACVDENGVPWTQECEPGQTAAECCASHGGWAKKRRKIWIRTQPPGL